MATRDPVLVPAEGAARDREPDSQRQEAHGRRDAEPVQLDADGVIVVWPLAARRATGLAEESVVGKKLQALCVDGAVDRTLASVRGRPLSLELSLDCGVRGAIPLHAVVSASRDSGGRLTGFDLDLQAAGAAQSSDFALAEAVAPEFAAARDFAMQESPAFLVDARTLRILESNAAAAAALGRSAHDMMGRSLQHVLDPTRNRVQRQVSDDRGIGMSHLRLDTPDGASRCYGVSLVPVRRSGQGLALCVLHELTGWVGMHMDLVASNEELSQLARHDHLTGLFNKAMFDDTLALANSRVDRSDKLMGVLYIDLDGFKSVNDRFGHDVGDRLLVEVVRRLQSGLRVSDVMARLGGDEFGAILENLRQRADALKVARSLISRLKDPFEAGGEQVSISASIGAVVTDRSVEDATALVAQADHMMYKAKSLGRGRAALAPVGALPKPPRTTRPS